MKICFKEIKSKKFYIYVNFWNSSTTMKEILFQKILLLNLMDKLFMKFTTVK
nr:MAG TPA: hypothetical protein [Caudoviricetes sp.]